MEEEKKEIKFGTLCLIVLCAILIIVGLSIYIVRQSNIIKNNQDFKINTDSSTSENTGSIETLNQAKEGYLEGQYFFNGDFYTDVGGYTFNSDYSVVFSDNRVIKGTYTIDGNNVNITFNTIILPGESVETEVEESQIEGICQEFIIVDDETITSKDGSLEYFKTKKLNKSALVGTWKIQKDDNSNGYIIFNEKGEYTDSISEKNNNVSGTYTINENEVILKSTNRETILHYLSEKAMLFQAENIVLEKASNIVIDTKVDTKSDTEENTNFIVLYNNHEIEKKVGIQYPSSMKKTEENKTKYDITYYNYKNGKYLGETKGEFGKEETYEGYSFVSNITGRIAISQKYDAIPRKYTRINKLPEELKDMADCTSVDIDSIDLDGDGKEEKIVCYTVSYAEGQIGDGKPQASSEIMLFDSNYKKINDLVSLQDGFWAGIKQEDKKIFLSLDDVEYIDIDNDGIMEIIIDVPMYEGDCISIIKYNNGKIEGRYGYKASVRP